MSLILYVVKDKYFNNWQRMGADYKVLSISDVFELIEQELGKYEYMLWLGAEKYKNIKSLIEIKKHIDKLVRNKMNKLYAQLDKIKCPKIYYEDYYE